MSIYTYRMGLVFVGCGSGSDSSSDNIRRFGFDFLGLERAKFTSSEPSELMSSISRTCVVLLGLDDGGPGFSETGLDSVEDIVFIYCSVFSTRSLFDRTHNDRRITG